jgi:hypothetical protein
MAIGGVLTLFDRRYRKVAEPAAALAAASSPVAVP